MRAERGGGEGRGGKGGCGSTDRIRRVHDDVSLRMRSFLDDISSAVTRPQWRKRDGNVAALPRLFTTLCRVASKRVAQAVVGTPEHGLFALCFSTIIRCEKGAALPSDGYVRGRPRQQLSARVWLSAKRAGKRPTQTRRSAASMTFSMS